MICALICMRNYHMGAQTDKIVEFSRILATDISMPKEPLTQEALKKILRCIYDRLLSYAENKDNRFEGELEVRFFIHESGIRDYHATEHRYLKEVS